jgi:flagellar hook-associated protein 1 FlgK
MGLNLLLDISRQSFKTLDAAMNVAGQNVANAETEGYSRRRVELSAVEMSRGTTFNAANGLLGGGVAVTGYQRVRDSMLDHARWEARGTLNYAREQERVMYAVEAMFPGGPGSLDESIDQMWNGWSDLADHPTDVGVRLSLRGRADAVVSKLNTLDLGLDRLQRESELTLADRVDEANTLLNTVATLNVQIAHATHAGSEDFAAMDQRDRALGRISELVPARFEEQEDGSTSVYIRSLQVIQQGHVDELELDATGATPEVTLHGSKLSFPSGLDTGEIGALLGPVITGISEARDKLDEIAATLVSQVNAIHSVGYGTDGSTGNDFFDATGITAGTIAVSSDIAEPQSIAASGDATAIGDNSNALAIHDIRYASVMQGNTQTIGDFSVDIVSGIGASVSAAQARAVGAESTVAGLDALAEGVSKVSIDDEMVGLIKLQQAYAASARVLATAESMFDTLLRI